MTRIQHFLTAALNLLFFCFHLCGFISTSVLFGNRDGAISAYHAWIDLLFQATTQQGWSLSLHLVIPLFTLTGNRISLIGVFYYRLSSLFLLESLV